MTLALKRWLSKLEKEPIENSLGIYDMKFEYPKSLDIYSDENGLILVWRRTKIPHISLFGEENSDLELLKENILPFHNHFLFILKNESQKELIYRNFHVKDQTKLYLYYLNKEDFSPIEEYKVDKLEQEYASFIWTHWEYSKEIKEANFINERLNNGYYYGIFLDNKIISYIGTIAELEYTVVLGMLFTKPEFRNKHYGTTCASYVTKLILESNRIPLCYAEVENKASTTIWEKLGFIKKPDNCYFIEACTPPK